jgi:hypothetical protein
MRELPLDDPRWCPLKAYIDRLASQRTGSTQRAVIMVEPDLESEALACKRGDELVPGKFWRDHVIDISLPFSIRVYPRTAVDDTPERWSMFAHDAVAGRIDEPFFVWLPDGERLHFTQADDDADSEPVREIDRAKAALRDIYQAKGKKPRTLKEAHTEAVKWCADHNEPLVTFDAVRRAAIALDLWSPRPRNR